jgi:chorismate synthase
LAVKPTSSISKTQRTIDREGRPSDISTHGRHDPCISPRVVPVAEAMCALVIYDAWLTQQDLQVAGGSRVEEWDWERVGRLFQDGPSV